VTRSFRTSPSVGRENAICPEAWLTSAWFDKSNEPRYERWMGLNQDFLAVALVGQ